VTADDLKKDKSRLIRNFRITKPKSVQKEITIVEKLSAEILKRIPEKEAETGVRDGRTRLVPNMLRGYFEDMNQVMKSGFDSLSSGGMMHIVVDQSAYVGVPIPTDLIFAALAKDIGYEVTGVISCRRANTSGQQLKKFPYLKDLLRESIVSLRKPM
jgi:site-specific DNA-methyltransferase (adenine-specific)